jgi:hypothetical protein
MSNQATEKKVPANKVITGKVRLSYAYLFEPKTQDDGSQKYQTAVLIPKTDKETLNKIKAAIDAVKKDPKSEKLWGKPFNAEMKSALRDGDLKGDEHPEYAGHYFFNCSSPQKPGIVDRKRTPITDPTEVYSGCYARVSVNFFAFNKGGGKGIGAWLNNVQKWEDGEPLSGSSRPEDDFDSLDDEDDEFLD